MGLHQLLLIMNKTSYNGVSDLVRECNKSVAASPFTEIVLLHFSSSMGWNLMLGQLLARSCRSPLSFYYITLRKRNHIYYKKEASSTEVKYKQVLSSHI